MIQVKCQWVHVFEVYWSVEIQDLKNSCCKYIGAREVIRRALAGELVLQYAQHSLWCYLVIPTSSRTRSLLGMSRDPKAGHVVWAFGLSLGLSFFCLFLLWGGQVKSSQVVGLRDRVVIIFLFFQNFSSKGVRVWGVLRKFTILLSNKTTRR
jgi:hypothetical protein